MNPIELLGMEEQPPAFRTHAPPWLTIATVTWWCVGPLPLLALGVPLALVVLLYYGVIPGLLLGVASLAIFMASSWTWFQPRDERLWVETLRSVLLALPLASSAWVFAIGLRIGSARLAGALDNLTLAPLEFSATAGALLCGGLLTIAVRQHTPAPPDPDQA